jgi:diguanylate cyclase (GGDEF)-like protein
MNNFRIYNDSIPFTTSFLTTVLGSLVLWGWFTNNMNLIYINSQFTGMHYNTALSFVAASTAIFALCKNYRLLSFLLGGFVLLVGYLTLGEYVFGLDSHFDTILMPYSIYHQNQLLYRMSPNGALMLGLMGTSILILSNYSSSKIELRKLLFILMILNTVVITISVMALIGYMLDLPGAAGWGSYTKMAIHTAIGNILLSIGIISIVFKKAYENNISFATWTPWFVFVILEVATLSFWQASCAYVEKNEVQQNTIAAKSIKSIINNDIEDRKETLSRMANRWLLRKGGTPKDEWIQDALNIYADQPGFQSIEWVDRNLFVRWIAPLKGNEGVLNLNLMQSGNRAEALVRAVKSGKITVTQMLTLKSGGKGFLIYVPIGTGKKFQGLIIGAIKAQSFFDEIFREAIADFNIAIYHQNELIYQRHPSDSLKKIHNSITYVIKEPYWAITSWPLPELAAKQRSWLPTVILIIGFLISVMLSLISYLAQIARSNAQKAKEEISTRQKAEQQLILYSKKLKKLSLVDPLTGVDNRRSLSTLMQRELAYMKEHDSLLSVILIDIDLFKQINDTYGHVTGDNVLQKVGSILRKNTRSTDTVARYGGEEFCIVLRNTNDRQAYTVAEKLRRLIAEQVFMCEKKKSFKVTCSFGVYQVSPKLKKITQVFEVVDGALYTAKNSGRNCVVLV